MSICLDNVFNAIIPACVDCYSGLQDEECQKNSSNYIFFNKTCMNANKVCTKLGFDEGNTTHCIFNNGTVTARGDTYNRTLASEEYYRYDTHTLSSALVMSCREDR